jgi:hypothetical protein
MLRVQKHQHALRPEPRTCRWRFERRMGYIVEAARAALKRREVPMTRKRFSLGLLIALLASGIATTEASVSS